MFKILPRVPVRAISLFSGAFAMTTRMDPSQLPVRPYVPQDPTGPFPYSQADMTPMDPGNDAAFYAPPRFVTHIDDNAIVNLTQYYDHNLPGKGSILDFCSSWVSHYPPRIAEAVAKGDLKVWGTGMNGAELARNPIFSPGPDQEARLGADSEEKRWWIQDLNVDSKVNIPNFGVDRVRLEASTCVVSIDYLTKPVEVLQSIREQTVEGGKVHLAISNRCFPTKAVGRWLRVPEKQRLEMVGDYLHWAGWKDIEIVDVVKGGMMTDPLWVVRATKQSD